MNENPFKIIEPREEVPEHLKEEVMGSVKTVVLILRMVQVFVGDFANIFIDKFKTIEKD